MKQDLIKPLQSWRGIMAIMIFILHICPEKMPLLAGGGETISFFIIMSGFGLALSNREYDCTVKEICVFTFQRIKKFWPLHMIMLIILLLITSVGSIITHNWSVLKDILLKFILNASLLQSYIPKDPWYYGLNGIAWYLSTSVFFYLLFIPLDKMIKKLSVKTCSRVIGGGIVLHFIVIALLQNNGNFYYWTYIFPPFRAIEFIIGVLLGNIFNMRKGHSVNRNLATVGEVLVVVAFLLDRVLCKYTTLYAVSHNYQSVVGVIIATGIVYVFAESQGVLSNGLCNKVSVYIGEISFEIYMIHTTILEIWYFLFSKFMGEVWNVPVILLITVFLAVVYHNKLWKRLRISR